MNSRIKINAIECAHCGEVVISTFRHHFATHTCGSMQEASGNDAFIAADGGEAYLRRCGNRSDWVEKAVWEDVDDSKSTKVPK